MKKIPKFSLSKLKSKYSEKNIMDTDTFRSEGPLTQRPLESFSEKNCKKCEHYKQIINNMSVMHQKEIQHYTFLLNFKDMALKKRDEMLYEYNQENLELKAKLQKLEVSINKANNNDKNLVSQSKTDRYNETNHDKYTETNQKLRPQTRQKLNHIKLLSQQSFSQSNFSQKESMGRSPSRSPTKRLSRRLSNFIVNSISLFNNDNHGMLTILMEEGEDPILNHPRVIELEEFLRTNSTYVETFNKMSFANQNDIFLTINTLFTEFKNNVNLIARLTKLIKSCQILSTSLVLDEALEMMVTETCENLKCDRGSVFILDEEKGELWSKVAKGTKIIRVPTNRGIAGYVAIHNTNLRIDNAYSDPRFNREIDKQTNYYTKTILSVPIKDINGKVVGVMQGINKINGFFTADDEGLMTILANQAGLILRNSLMYDKLVINQYKLLKLVNIGMSLFQCINLEMVMIRAEQKLMDLANTDKCIIYLIDQETGQLLRYDTDKNIRICENNIGIIGECIRTGTQIETLKPDNEPLYNNKVDLDTHLSLLTIPVKSEDLNRIIAVFQIINIHATIGKHLGKTSNLDLDIILFFVKIFTICIENALNIRKRMEEIKNTELSKETKKKYFKRMSVGEINESL